MVRRNTRRRKRRMRGGSNVSDAVNKQYSASCLKNQTNAFAGPKGGNVKGLTTVTQTGGGFGDSAAPADFPLAPLTRDTVGRSPCDPQVKVKVPSVVHKGGKRTRRTKRTRHAKRGGGAGLPIIPTSRVWWPTLSGTNNTYNLSSSSPKNSIVTLLDGSKVDSQQPPFGPRQGLQSAPGKGKTPVVGLGTSVFSSRYGGGRGKSKGKKCNKCKRVHRKKTNCPHYKRPTKGTKCGKCMCVHRKKSNCRA